jgi:hypothetical protein
VAALWLAWACGSIPAVAAFQLNEERRFGRRLQLGFQIAF